MRSQSGLHETRRAALATKGAAGVTLPRRATLLALVVFVCCCTAWPSILSAQEPGTAPEVNAPADAPQRRPLNNDLSQAMNQRRGMPTNVVHPQQQLPPPLDSPAADAAANGSAGSNMHGKNAAPQGTAIPAPATASPAPATSSVAPPSMLQLPAHRAQVHVGESGLTVQADNSNLSQVLRDIGSATGMQVEGMGHDERIFGNYGPGAPRDVLTSLLYGTGYNVLMVGEIAQGAPRQLLLSQRNSTSTQTSAEPAKTNPDEEDAEPDPGEGQDIEAPPVPNQGMPAQPDGSEVRTPQQMLEQLQRMHEDPTPPEPQPPQQQ